MKKCSCCNEIKELCEFGKSKKNKDGLDYRCKICRRKSTKDCRLKYPEKTQARTDIWLEKNYEKNRLTVNKRNHDHPEKGKINRDKYRAKYPDKVKESMRIGRAKWKKNNSDIINANTALRTARKKQQTLKLIEKQDKPFIRVFYKHSVDLKKSTGIQHHVDHIIPFVGVDKTGLHIVSGLHVSWNLQVLSQHENVTKHNKFDGTYDNEGWRNDL